MRIKSVLVLVVVTVLLAGVTFVPAAAAAEPASLSVEVTTDTDGYAELGRDCTYTITVRNTGPVDVSDVTVDDTFLGHVGSIASLPAGEAIQFQKTIVMRDPGSGSCTVTGRGPQGEEVIATAEHSVELFIGDDFADLRVSKRVVAGSAVPGGTLYYRVVVSNVAQNAVDADAPTCSVVDDFDQNRTTVLDAGGGTISAGRLLWTIDVPGPGESTVIEYSLRVRADAEGTVINTVVVEYELDSSAGDNAASVRTAVVRSTSNGGSGSGGDTAASGAGRSAASASSDEPFLPFTGTEDSRAQEVAIAFLILGFALRVAARQDHLT